MHGLLLCHRVVVITTVQLHSAIVTRKKIFFSCDCDSAKPKPRFCTGSNPARGVLVSISNIGPGWK